MAKIALTLELKSGIQNYRRGEVVNIEFYKEKDRVKRELVAETVDEVKRQVRHEIGSGNLMFCLPLARLRNTQSQ